METFWLALAKKAIDALVGGEATKLIKQLVAQLMNQTLTNDEKREYVKSKVLPFVGKIGEMFLSTAIAMTVDYLKAQTAGTIK